MALKADYIVRSQRVFTSAPGAASARPLAFAVAADHIAYVDEFDRVQAEAGSGTPVVDLGDALVCPGFHDAHLHFFQKRGRPGGQDKGVCGVVAGRCLGNHPGLARLPLGSARAAHQALAR